MEEESIISKLRKLKALVDGGVGGEAINAKNLLFQLLKKYNLNYEDVFNEDIKKDYAFSYSSNEERKLFFNCIANVFGTKSDIWKDCYRYRNGKMIWYLKLTTFEYILFKDFYEFHRKYWKEYIKTQMDLLMKAYIKSQGIYDISPKEEGEELKMPSPEELRELWAIQALSEQMKDHVPQYRKALK